MKRIFLIGHHDVWMFLKPKTSYIWLAIMPLVFVYFMGMAFKGPGDPSNPRPSVLIENADTNFLSAILLAKLDAAGMNTLSEDRKGEAERGIRIPENFTESVMNREQTKIEFFTTSESGDQSAMMIEMRLLRAVISLNSDIIQLAQDGGHEAINEENFEKLQDQEMPVALGASFAGRNPIPSGFAHSLPANMVMFIMINLLVFGGTSVSQERGSGVIRRMAAYPMTRWQLITGKVYGRFLLGVFQVVVFMLAGRFIFEVQFGGEPWVLFVGLLLFCWVAASLGVLIGSLIAGEEKTTGVCVASALVMGALGGCWWPMEIVSDTMQVVGHLTPTAWAMDLMHRLISFGGGAGDVVTEVGVLLGFAVGANALAAKFFKY